MQAQLIIQPIQNKLSVREITENDFSAIVDYFLNADSDFLLALGVDASIMPERKAWLNLLADDYHQSVENKKFYYIIWLLDGTPVGHSNINKIIFGKEAYMHLHMWQLDNRQKGIGLQFVQMSVPYYINNFKLKNLYCEPYALNLPPNKTLQKAGFDFREQYETTPGWLNFFQKVNKWCMSNEKYKTLYGLVKK